MDEIIEVIDKLPFYISYLYPGYITIYIFYFLKAGTLSDSRGIVIKSVAISFLYKICLDKVLIDTDVIYHFWMICISAIVPYIGYLIQKSEAIYDVFDILDISTRFESNEIDVLDNGEYSAFVKVYLIDEEVVYEGYLGERELEPGKRQFITLIQYKKYFLDENGKPKEPYIEECNDVEDKVIIFYNRIKRIEKNKI